MVCFWGDIMINMKERLLEKTFKQQQYTNELNYIINNWFDNLIVDENYTKEKDFLKHIALFNGKKYDIYFRDNKFEFTLIPKTDDLFSGDFDDIVTFSKSNSAITLDIKNKNNGIYSDTNYRFELDDFNDIVKCNCNYREFSDDDKIYNFYLNSDATPYYFINHYLINGNDYWYKANIRKTPSHCDIKVFDSNNDNKSEKIMYNENSEDINVSMISKMYNDLHKKAKVLKIS